MALANVSLDGLYLDMMNRVNQIVMKINDAYEGYYKTTGTIEISNPSFANSNVSLNVSNGYIKGNAAGLTFVPNTSIQGKIINSQIQNSSITITANQTNLLAVYNSPVSLGGTVFLSANISPSILSNSDNSFASSSAVNTVHNLVQTLNANTVTMNTVQTLINKTINGGTITGANISLGYANTVNINSPIIVGGYANTVNINNGTLTGTFSGSPTINGSVTITNTTDGLIIRPAGLGSTAYLQMGRIDGYAVTNRIDFNSGVTPVDYDVRIQALGGTGVTGEGSLGVYAGSFSVSSDTFTHNGVPVANTDGIQTFTNKTIAASNLRSNVAFTDTTDNTKRLQFSIANVTTGTTRTLSAPDATGTIALEDRTVSNVITTVYTSGSGTHTFSNKLLYAEVELVGGGGGGGGADGDGVGAMGGSGGTGGVYVFKKLGTAAANVAASYSVGAAGAAGAGAAGVNNGGDGGSTTLTVSGTTYSANGGLGGGGRAAISTSNFYPGTTPSAVGTHNGDYAIQGGPSGQVRVVSGSIYSTSEGGDSQKGYGGKAIAANDAGIDGGGYGAGGSGACVISSSSSNISGGAGSGGIIIIREFVKA